MADNNLAVKITADIAELEVKFRLAQAEARSLSSELNRLASASSKGIVDPSASAQLAGVAARMLEARQTAAALSGQIQASGVAVGGFGRISEMSGREVAMSARHFHSLFDELKAGNASGAEVPFFAWLQAFWAWGRPLSSLSVASPLSPPGLVISSCGQSAHPTHFSRPPLTRPMPAILFDCADSSLCRSDRVSRYYFSSHCLKDCKRDCFDPRNQR